MNISFEGWLLIILAALLILALIGFTINVMKKYPPESVFPPDQLSESDVILAIIEDDILDDD